MSCFSCQSEKIVHIVADGDIVCTSCGVVQQGHVIDDTYWGNKKYTDNMDYEHPKPTSEPPNPLMATLKEACLHLLNMENTFVIERTMYFIGAINSKDNSVVKRGDRKRAVLATCFYLATREAANIGLHANVVYDYFGVPMWKEYTYVICMLDLKVEKDILFYDSLRRMVYDCPDIDINLQWRIIKMAETVREKVHGIVGSSGKPSKLNACYIYIAWKLIEPTKVCLQSFCAHFDISVSTLHKHELLIQTAFQTKHYTQPNNISSRY